MRAELAADLALSLDPARLMEAAGLVPDRWQAELLRSDASRVLLLCARQTGKSTTAAMQALHQAIYRPPALVLVLSPTQRQSGELFKKIRSLYSAVGSPIDVPQESALRLELQNGSRILSLPGKEDTIRGFSGVDLIIVDEAARVLDELYYAVRPMLAVSGGRLMALSTPFGKRGWFHSEWSSDRDWLRVKVTARDCPRISEDFLAEERMALGDWWYTQEYEVKFRDAIDSVFSHAAVMASLTETVTPLRFESSPPEGVRFDENTPPSSFLGDFRPLESGVFDDAR
jgi:hypothetical protein